MKNIWKFKLKPSCTIEMPEGAHLLSVAGQRDDICLWAQVDSAAPKAVRHFRVFGTGHPMPDDLDMRFVGTAMLNSGAYVFHVFEVES